MPHRLDGPRRPRLSLTAGVVATTAVVLGLITVPSVTAATEDDSPSRAQRLASALSPSPRSLRDTGPDLPLPAQVRVIAGQDTDRPALRSVVDTLRTAGVAADVTAPGGPPAAFTVWVGGPKENPAAAEVLRELEVTGPRELPAGGYVLASGQSDQRPGTHLVLSGADASGTYYAAQTARQLLGTAARSEGPLTLPSVTVRDWPSMSWRGVIEGFYGAPWSQRDRLRQLDFYGAHKMNTYVYAPKDDPYHREKWREAYPAERLADLRELSQRATARHVDLVFTISPGLDVCHSDPADLKALTDKARALWDVGVRTFGLFFDDIGRELHCEQDRSRFGADADPLAAAQAHLLNAFQREFLDQRTDAGRLLTVPTEYSGTGGSTYRERFATLVDEDVLLYWTGPEVVSPTIGTEDADAARAVFRHDLILWDNYPVNDYLPRQMFLGPLTGRAGALPKHGIVGLTANPMPQAEPSTLPLATVADYAWDAGGYDAERSWQAALRDIGGPARDALYTFADNSRSSDLDATESPRLTARVKDFWAAYDAGDPRGKAARALLAEFTAMERAPQELRERLHPSFAEQAQPWLTKLRWYGAAGAAATRSLMAQAGDSPADATQAWRERVSSVRAAETSRQTYETVATGVMRRFLHRAAEESRVVTVNAPETTPPDAAVTLTAEVRAGDTPIEKVEFYAGPKKVGEATSAPYQFRWSAAPSGLHLVTAKAVAADGDTVSSAPARMTSGTPKPVLLLVGDDAPIPEGETISAGDSSARDRLEYLGYPVVVATGESAQPGDAEGKAAVVISSTLASGEVKTKFRAAAVPVLTWEAYLFDDMGMATGPGETFRQSQLRIARGDSPLAAGLSGVVAVYRGLDRVRWGTPTAAAETAAVTVDGDKAALFGYRTGDALVDLTAPAPRVGLFLGDEGLDPDVVTSEGQRLFDAAVRYALE